MNNYIVLIAQNGNITPDMFDTTNSPVIFDSTNIDESSFDTNYDSNPPQQDYNQNNYQTTSEIPALPAVTPERPSEMQTVMQKSSISFGILAIIVIFILLVAFIYKKTRTVKQYTYDESEEDFKENLETTVQRQENVQPKKKNQSKLNTSSTIHRCIVSFLEVTKEV